MLCSKHETRTNLAAEADFSLASNSSSPAVGPVVLTSVPAGLSQVVGDVAFLTLREVYYPRCDCWGSRENSVMRGRRFRAGESVTITGK